MAGRLAAASAAKLNFATTTTTTTTPGKRGVGGGNSGEWPRSDCSPTIIWIASITAMLPAGRPEYRRMRCVKRREGPVVA